MIKDHEIAAAVNALRDIAIEHHGSQSLRDRISALVVPLLRAGAPDGQRLNWLGRAGDVSLGVIGDAPEDGQFYLSSDLTPVVYGTTLREAIDKAIAWEQA